MSDDIDFTTGMSDFDSWLLSMQEAEETEEARAYWASIPDPEPHSVDDPTYFSRGDY